MAGGRFGGTFDVFFIFVAWMASTPLSSWFLTEMSVRINVLALVRLLVDFRAAVLGNGLGSSCDVHCTIVCFFCVAGCDGLDKAVSPGLPNMWIFVPTSSSASLLLPSSVHR